MLSWINSAPSDASSFTSLPSGTLQSNFGTLHVSISVANVADGFCLRFIITDARSSLTPIQSDRSQSGVIAASITTVIPIVSVTTNVTFVVPANSTLLTCSTPKTLYLKVSDYGGETLTLSGVFRVYTWDIPRGVLPIYVNNDGTVSQVKKVFTNVDGSIKECRVFTNANGSIKELS